jgi:alpha-beta hydrolase superfamily lysophospholipase
VQLYVRHWEPEDRHPSAVLLMVHGATWHGKFFAPAARHFVEHYGWAVLTLDLPSHGQSGSATGEGTWEGAQESSAGHDRPRHSLTMLQAAAGGNLMTSSCLPAIACTSVQQPSPCCWRFM